MDRTDEPAAEVSEDLRARFRAHADDDGYREKVIVTLHPDAGAAEAAAAGLRIESVMQAQPIVIGTIDATALRSLSKSAGVARIESDSQMGLYG